MERGHRRVYQALVTDGPPQFFGLMDALRQSIGANQMMAYLTMMAARLVELHRVLKPTGSLYLHCDPTASHYLKIILDAIFGPERFVNEISWKRSSTHSDTAKASPVGGFVTLLFYTKSQTIRGTHSTPRMTMITRERVPARRGRWTPIQRNRPDRCETGQGISIRLGRTKTGRAGHDGQQIRPRSLATQARMGVESGQTFSGALWAFSKTNLIEFARRAV